MSKLFKLKRWLTLDEAAEHLAKLLQEPVSVPDLLRLALDGHLVLSVNIINGASANYGRKVSLDQARLTLFPRPKKKDDYDLTADQKQLLKTYPRDGTREEQHVWLLTHREISDHPDILIFPVGDRVGPDEIIEWDDSKVSSIRDLWDIPLSGGGRLDLEHMLQSLVGGPAVTLTCLDGAYVVSTDGETYARILEHFEDNPYLPEDDKDPVVRAQKYPYGDPRSYYPRGGLPDDASIVVRPQALTRFLAGLAEGADEQADKPLGSRERNNLLRVIRVLCDRAGLDLNRANVVADVESALELAGYDGPKEKTLRSMLGAARDVI